MDKHFNSIVDKFSFGKYKECSLADVLVFNRSYFYWCLDNVEEITFSNNVISEIKRFYPYIIIPEDISSKIRNY